jgi:hypothetical protein
VRRPARFATAQNDGRENSVQGQIDQAGPAADDPEGLITEAADQLGASSKDSQTGRGGIEEDLLWERARHVSL